MKRVILFSLLAALLLSLCGCGAGSPAPDDDLTPVLDSIAASVHPGTAGSSLTAAQEACALMDWCCETNMDETAIRKTVEGFLAGRDEEEQRLFTVQIGFVCSTADYLMSEDGAGLLSDIGGGEGTRFPWPDAPLEKLTAILNAADAE